MFDLRLLNAHKPNFKRTVLHDLFTQIFTFPLYTNSMQSNEVWAVKDICCVYFTLQ